MTSCQTLRRYASTFQLSACPLVQSDELANFLVGCDIPKRITELPQQFLATPMGQTMRPMFEQQTVCTSPPLSSAAAPRHRASRRNMPM